MRLNGSDEVVSLALVDKAEAIEDEEEDSTPELQLEKETP
jgi:hypothetical protein